MPNSKPILKDEYLGGRTAEEQEQQDALEAKAADHQADQASSASERELASLRAQLEEERAKNTRWEEARKKWASGDFSGLAEDHPFEVLCHTHEDPARNWDVPVAVNGEKWKLRRGVTYILPFYAVKVLQASRITGWVKMVNPETGDPQATAINHARYPHDARPLPEYTPWKRGQRIQPAVSVPD